jgi:hypothetical protein
MTNQQPQLGTLKEINVRDAWPHEAHSFTPWLAQHLHLLATEVGIPLELEGQEVSVEQFSADILARNPQDGTMVLIENQLEGSDHKHLGQIMTYLAGLEAKTIIWVATGFEDAHLSAINWLNEHTADEFLFFAVKIKVVRIGDSPMAPIFEIIARPNTWERQLHAQAKESGEMTDLGKFRKSFWAHYLARYPDQASFMKADGKPNQWKPLPDWELYISFYPAKQECGIFIRGRRGANWRDVYDLLQPYQEQIEQQIGSILRQEPGGHFLGAGQKFDSRNPTNWDDMSDWFYEKIQLYTNAFEDINLPEDSL